MRAKHNRIIKEKGEEKKRNGRETGLGFLREFREKRRKEET